jgi:hypothetical protein
LDGIEDESVVVAVREVASLEGNVEAIWSEKLREKSCDLVSADDRTEKRMVGEIVQTTTRIVAIEHILSETE